MILFLCQEVRFFCQDVAYFFGSKRLRYFLLYVKRLRDLFAVQRVCVVLCFERLHNFFLC